MRNHLIRRMLQGKLKLPASHVQPSGGHEIGTEQNVGYENDVGVGEQQGSGQENTAGWAEMSRWGQGQPGQTSLFNPFGGNPIQRALASDYRLDPVHTPAPSGRSSQPPPGMSLTHIACLASPGFTSL